jgi:transposase
MQWNVGYSIMNIGKVNITKALENVEILLREDKTASPQIRAMMELLVVVINLLLGKLGLNSSNSSIPPSKDTERKRGSKRKKKGKKRKPGGQQGHEGTNLKREKNPDLIEIIEVDRRTIPQGQYTEIGYESRQVINIEISKHVTEYQAQILQDVHGSQFVADFPAGVSRPVQYGSSIKTQSVYMSQQQLVPYDRVRDYFADQCKIPVSTGSLFNFNKQAFELLEEYESLVKLHLITRPLLHADETGININGKLLCHDHFKAYFKFGCTHALCNAHHLRELERAWEHDGHRWAKKMQDLLLEINDATTKAGGCLTEEAAKSFRSRYRNTLTRGDKECPPPDPKKHIGKRGRPAKTRSRNLLERLRDFEEETLRFMTDNLVPFTNNQGENDIRMTKVQQLSTCSKHDVSPTDALQMLFDGRLPEFVVKLE